MVEPTHLKHISLTGSFPKGWTETKHLKPPASWGHFVQESMWIPCRTSCFVTSFCSSMPLMLWSWHLKSIYWKWCLAWSSDSEWICVQIFWEKDHQFSRWWQLKRILGCFIPGDMIQFDEHIFQMGWFNHQLIVGLATELVWMMTGLFQLISMHRWTHGEGDGEADIDIAVHKFVLWMCKIVSKYMYKHVWLGIDMLKYVTIC